MRLFSLFRSKIEFLGFVISTGFMKLFMYLFACILAQLSLFGITKLEITGNDQMQFSTREFIVKAGDEVEIVFKNIGKPFLIFLFMSFINEIECLIECKKQK